MTREELLALIDQAAEEGWTELDLSGNGLTELPAEIGKLTQLETLILGKVERWEWVDGNYVPTLVTNTIDTLPNQLSRLESLKTLDLSGNPLKGMPKTILQLRQLTCLKLVRTNLLEIAGGIEQLANLTELDLRQNQLNEIPASVGQLANLTELYLRQNQLSQIPASVGQLANLATLDLRQNQISKIPIWLSQLKNLTKLSLWRNQICEIPEYLGELTNLIELDLAQNQISEIPDCIGQLTNLTELYLSQNQIYEIPECIGQLTNLTKLFLRQNQIREIPKCISQLTNLTELALGENQISEIPNCIDQLTNLTKLSLWRNRIREIPECIGQLTNLTGLDLNHNQIREIPECFGRLTKLTGLYLIKNQIREIPECLGQLTNLTGLGLSQNQISKLPTHLGQLNSLTMLVLHQNQIREIPEWLGQLTNLTELHLTENQIREIPECLGQLTNLTGLSLSQNQIREIPECLSQLANLTGLHLSHNQISEIPDFIAQLTKLVELDLARNTIRELPTSITRLENLQVLHLNDNPLPVPPETLRQGWGEKYTDPGNPQSVLNYYFTTRDPDQTQLLYEVKLLLVGEGGAGKTSLANKLLDLNYELKPETEDTSTKGIDILKWEFTGRNGNSYCIKIWDFGGQEIYHQTHQFFLTERSLYLLVADSRKEDTDHYFWLKSVQLLSNHSPVLLVQNEKQNRTCNLNVNQLRGEFANLRDTHRVNLADNRGLAELQSAIQYELEKLIPNGIPFPNKWLAVRYALANDGRSYIDRADYEATCRNYGITSREEMFQLSRFLHELGICLHFQKDPVLCHRLILKPNWGTAAVYKILDNETVKQNLGQFSDADLEDIWAAPEYADMRYPLLQLMQEFKVCYEIPRRKGQYIAPHLLSADSPAYDWNPEHNLILRYRYKDFMPKGILTRLIVEMHQDIENVSDPEQALVWKSGVVLTNGVARAEVIEYYPQRQIRIRVSGSRPRDLLTIVNRKFQEIHDSFDDRLNYDTLIPCNCTTCKPSQDPFTFPLERLYQCIDQRRSTIECHESGEDVNVRGLIDGVILETPDFLNEFDEFDDLGSLEEFTGKPNRPMMVRSRRGYPRSRPQPPNPSVNLSVTVPIHNNNQQSNQQEQAMSNDKIWHGDRVDGDKVMGDKVAGNKMQAGTVHGDAIAGNKIINSQNLAQAAQDIKALLNQLDKDYDCTTPTGQAMITAKTIEAIEKDPTLKARVVNALKEGGTTALETAIDHPAVKPVVAMIKGFMDAK